MVCFIVAPRSSPNSRQFHPLRITTSCPATSSTFISRMTISAASKSQSGVTQWNRSACHPPPGSTPARHQLP
ncbi:unnamed protein product [Periconia digitata]|uniref:Uncharacterized protein n=1 Tax=Periconia digitata TaxID=1303443 RepID=A0A9W4UHU9_9PLEO|nr:unnamed protein product [Periconia digitata]